MSKVIAIIVTYNGARWIERCLTSLLQSSVPVDVIVIDNHSADNTVEIIQQKYNTVHLILSEKNLGFGQANNLGIQYALHNNAEFVFLLNQDAWVEKNTIEDLIHIASRNNDFGILSPFHTTAEKNKLERQFVDFVSSHYNEDIISDLFFNTKKELYATTYIHAAAWLITRTCIEKVGGFDPLYFHYGEDDDYMQRVKHFSFKIGLVPSAIIVHDGEYKTWSQLVWNENRNLVMEFQKLKTMNPHFRTNLLVYVKGALDEITTLLILRKFKKLRFRSKIIWKTLCKMRKIYASYKLSFTEKAFLLK